MTELAICPLCHARAHDGYRTVHQDELVFVLMNVEPLKPGHVMVMPARHVERLAELRPDEAAAFLKAIDACMNAATAAFGEDAMCLVNGWQHRSQLHLHAHVIPSAKDMRGLYAAAEGVRERVRQPEDVLRAMTEKFKQALKI